MSDAVVIIGTGLAGYTVAREFRKLDKESPLHLISSDDGAFYSKPMLSNALSSGKTPAALATFSAEQMATQLQANIHTHAKVTSLDPDSSKVVYRDARGQEQTLPYARLVLALGASPVQLSLAGDAAEQVQSVNNLTDYVRFREDIKTARRIVILGAGFVGCEFANDLASAGFEVTLVDMANTPLSRFLLPEVAIPLRQALTDEDITWLGGQMATAVNCSSNGLELQLKAVETQTVTKLETDVVLSAAGLRPSVALAEAAGLSVSGAIEVDSFLQTTKKNISALGDCAQVAGMWLPFVMPLMHAARALAKNLAGETTAVHYPAMPVVVKTPCYPLVIAKPGPGVDGQWQVQAEAAGVRATFVSASGEIQGFILSGEFTREKNDLIKQMPGLF